MSTFQLETTGLRLYSLVSSSRRSGPRGEILLPPPVTPFLRRGSGGEGRERRGVGPVTNHGRTPFVDGWGPGSGTGTLFLVVNGTTFTTPPTPTPRSAPSSSAAAGPTPLETPEEPEPVSSTTATSCGRNSTGPSPWLRHPGGPRGASTGTSHPGPTRRGLGLRGSPRTCLSPRTVGTRDGTTPHRGRGRPGPYAASDRGHDFL